MCGHKHRFCKTAYFSEHYFHWVPNKHMNFLGCISMHSIATSVKFPSNCLPIFYTPHSYREMRRGGEGPEWRKRRILEQYFPDLFNCNTLCYFQSLLFLPPTSPGSCPPQGHIPYGDTITSRHLTKTSYIPSTLDSVPWVFLSCLGCCAFMNGQCAFSLTWVHSSLLREEF